MTARNLITPNEMKSPEGAANHFAVSWIESTKWLITWNGKPVRDAFKKKRMNKSITPLQFS